MDIHFNTICVRHFRINYLLLLLLGNSITVISWYEYCYVFSLFNLNLMLIYLDFLHKIRIYFTHTRHTIYYYADDNLIHSLMAHVILFVIHLYLYLMKH